jgi:hypothetical protein
MKYTVEVKPTDKPREWVVTKGFSYGPHVIPIGFTFDGASIPIGLRWLFPHGGNKFAPACLHDYLYRTGVVSKEEADRLFLSAMLENGVKPWKAKSMYHAVRLCGGPAWRKRRREDSA